MSTTPTPIEPITPLEVRSTASKNIYTPQPVPVPSKTSYEPEQTGFKGFLAKAWETTQNSAKAVKTGVNEIRDGIKDKQEQARKNREKQFQANYDHDKAAGANATPYYRDKDGSRMYYPSQQDLDRAENVSHVSGQPVLVEGERGFGHRFKALTQKVREGYDDWKDKLETPEQYEKESLIEGKKREFANKPIDNTMTEDNTKPSYTNYKNMDLHGMLGKANGYRKALSRDNRGF